MHWGRMSDRLKNMNKKQKVEEAFMDHIEDSLILAKLVEKHGELESTVYFDMDDWSVGGNEFWLQDVPTCDEDQCPCQEDQ